MSDVTMPQLGETVTEGTITRWAKSVGDHVAMDEVLFEVSTDKVDSEVPSPGEGTLIEILVQEGETADVGTVIAKIGEAGSGEQSGQSSQSEDQQGEQQSADQQGDQSQQGAPGESPLQQEAPLQEEAPRPSESPTTSKPPASPVPSESSGISSGAGSSEGGGAGGKVLSPIVRKLISENGLDASQINGTGVGGRITREDVERHLSSAGQGSSGQQSSGGAQAPAPQQPSAAPAAPAQQPVAVPSPPQLPPATASERDTVVPFSNIRKRTAEHMVMSQATSAHTFVSIEVDYSNVDKVRNARKEQFKKEEGASLTYMPFITRAIVDAVAEFPYANASVGNNELIVHRDVNVGVAVDLNFEGLLVPVVHGADGLRLRQIARGIADLAHRARNKKIQVDDLAGGTITITNAGSYGTFVTYPVINQPQVAIISTDGVKKRPVVVELPDGNDAIVAHPVGMLALAWDHRAFDGAYASAFLAKVKQILETRDWSAEL